MTHWVYLFAILPQSSWQGGAPPLTLGRREEPAKNPEPPASDAAEARAAPLNLPA